MAAIFLQAPELGNPVRVRSSNRCCMRRSFLFAVRTGHWETEKVEQKTQESLFPNARARMSTMRGKFFCGAFTPEKAKNCGKIRPPKVFIFGGFFFCKKEEKI